MGRWLRRRGSDPAAAQDECCPLSSLVVRYYKISAVLSAHFCLAKVAWGKVREIAAGEDEAADVVFYGGDCFASNAVAIQ